MVPGPLKLVYKHINFLIKNLSKKNYKNFITELTNYGFVYGFDVESFIFQCCVANIDLMADINQETSLFLLFLSNEYQRIMRREDFLTVLCKVFDKQSSFYSGNFLKQFFQLLHLKDGQSLLSALALTHSSDPKIVNASTAFIQELFNTNCREDDDNEFGSGYFVNISLELSIEMIHFLIIHIIPKNQWNFNVKNLQEHVVSSIQKNFPINRVPLVLLPILYPQNVFDLSLTHLFPSPTLFQSLETKFSVPNCVGIEEWASNINYANTQNNHFADYIAELGYACTSSKEMVYMTLSEFDKSELTTDALAQCICLFMSCPNDLYRNECGNVKSAGFKPLFDSLIYTEDALQYSLHVCGSKKIEPYVEELQNKETISKLANDDSSLSTWNLDNFLQVFFEINPQIYLEQIILALDRPEFIIQNKTAFQLLNQFFKICPRKVDPFPANFFYRQWNNSYSQFTLLKACSIYQDVLVYHEHEEVDLSNYQIPSYNGCNFIINIWGNCQYLDTLLMLSERGLFNEIRELINYPLQNCPDILAANLLRSQHYCGLRSYLLRELIMNYLFQQRNPNGITVLKTAWATLPDQALVIATCIQYLEQILSSSLSNQLAENPGSASIMNDALTKFLELLILVPPVYLPASTLFSLEGSSGISENTRSLLATILGSKTAPSVTVSSFLRVQGIEPISKSGICDSDKMLDIKPSFHCSLDLVIALLCRVANTISNLQQQRNCGDFFTSLVAASNGKIAFNQSEMKHFLTNWFTERIREQNADSFVHDLVNYVQNRFSDVIQQNGDSEPNLYKNIVYPIELRKPSNSLIIYVLQAAIGAFNSPSSQASVIVVGEACQLFNTFIQSLNSPSKTSLTVPPPGILTSTSSQPIPLIKVNPMHNSYPSGINNRLSNLEDQQTINKFHTMLDGQGGTINGTGVAAFLEPPLGQLDHAIALTLNTDLIKNDHPKHLDNDANAFFTKVLGGDNMAKAVFEALMHGPPAQKKFMDNILKTLAEEVSIHLHEYPEDMLNPICELYGDLLAYGTQLFSKRALSVLWRAVLVALYNHPPESSKLVLTGMIKIFIRAKHTFGQFSNLASCFINAPLFNQFPLELKEYILTFRDNAANVKTCTSEVAPYRSPDPPEESICDRVLFLFNNVSNTNVIEKSNELAQLVDEAIIPWFAYYLIGKRVTLELNFHPIFSTVLDNMQEKLPKIRESVKFELLRSIKQILRNVRSDTDDTSSRSNLKNLGNFLGLITLAKNKPILHDEICLKELLYEAFQKGPTPIRYIIPFVSSILCHAINSIVFPPPNPWTMAILKVLREYHTLKNSNEKMRFDIELLFQKLGQKLENVQIITYLRDPSVYKSIDSNLILVTNETGSSIRPDSLPVQSHMAPDQQQLLNMMAAMHQDASDRPHGFPATSSTPSATHATEDFAQYSQQNVEAWTRDQQQQQQQQQQMLQQMMRMRQQPSTGSSRPLPESTRGHTPPSSLVLPSYSDVDLNSIFMACNIEEQFHRGDPRFAAVAGLFDSKPELRSSIQSAIETTLKETCSTIYDRCHKITIPTVLAIVRKDFALDPDFTRFRVAGAQMVRHLAASLTFVSGRDTLNNMLSQRVGHVLMNAIASSSGARPGSNFAPTEGERETINFITQAIVHRGSNACLAYTQKTVAESILQELDSQFELDLKQRIELGPNRFVEQASNNIAQTQMAMPVKLRLSSGKPADQDIVVYEEFRLSVPGFSTGSVPQLSRTNLPPQIHRYQQQMQQKLSQMRQQQATPASHPIVVPPTGPVQGGPSAHNTVFFDTITEIFERHVSEIRHNSCAPNDPILQSMSSLIQIIQNAKSSYKPQVNAPGGLPGHLDKEIATNIVSAVVKSIFTHLKASQRPTERSGGQDIMQHFMEAVMTTLRQLQSQFPYYWITKQVTHAWISLPDSSESDYEDSSKSVASSSKRVSIKWNWQAFIELLRVHIVSLPEIDAYLAEQVLKGSEATITFVLDILDYFILPGQNSLSTHMQVQASLTPTTSTHPLGSVPGANPLGPIGSSITTTTSTSNPIGTVASTTSSQASYAYKRQFTVLNEYDIWGTLEALRFRVAEAGADATPSSLRLRISCARVRALLDLGLMETALLQIPSVNSSQQGSPIISRKLTSMGVAALYSGCSQAREFDDSKHVLDGGESMSMMQRWIEAYQISPHRNCHQAEQLLVYFNDIGLLGSESHLMSFCRTVTQGVIEKALNHLRHTQSKGLLQGQVHVNAYGDLDAYARLMACLIKRCRVKTSEYNAEQDIQMKIQMLNKILGLIAGMLLQENEVRREMFHSMPFERIINRLFFELFSLSTNPPLTASETNPDSTNKKKTNASAQESSQQVAAALQNQIPIAFSHLLHILRPEKATMFVFSWLELLAHRQFIGKILAVTQTMNSQSKVTYQSMYAQLLVDLLKYLAFFLQNALLPKSIQHLYRATLRLFIVLIHDFPDFVCNYYCLFCDVLPTNTVQMRNLVLSALPTRNMLTTNPLQSPPNDHLSALDDPSDYCMTAGQRLPAYLKREIDAYLMIREPTPMMTELWKCLRLTDDEQLINLVTKRFSAQKLEEQPVDINDSVSDMASIASTDRIKSGKIKSTTPSETNDSLQDDENDSEFFNIEESHNRSDEMIDLEMLGDVSALWSVRTVRQFATFGQADCMHYNMELITNLVIYLCLTAVRTLRTHSLPLNMETIAGQPQMDIVHGLVLSLDNEGRYLLLNCMANQLRYPNSHTYYFSFAILHLFSHQTASEAVKEQISRVLMERLIVAKPHPWGLLMTTSELLRNPSYGFWEHDFARSNQDITSILTQVAERCIPNFQVAKIPRTTMSGAPLVRLSGSGTSSILSC